VVQSAYLYILAPQMEVANSVVWKFWLVEREKKVMVDPSKLVAVGILLDLVQSYYIRSSTRSSSTGRVPVPSTGYRYGTGTY
jgi:hypothetical protein